MTKQAYLTFSIDDGHPTDLKTAELLSRFGFKGTFYISSYNPDRAVMSHEEIYRISQGFEIGSHTLNHKPLKYLADKEAIYEIGNGKKWLEDVIGNDVIAFCYPNGKFHSRTVEFVRQAGFLGARTCMFNLSRFPNDPFLWGVSTHGYSHSVTIQLRHALLERNFQGVLNFVAIHKVAFDWSEHFMNAVEYVRKYGGVAHLYFHSWEIEAQGEWGKLENLLEIISKNKNLICLTNGDLFRLWHNLYARDMS